jgi:CheY-like chemotaxis protein
MVVEMPNVLYVEDDQVNRTLMAKIFHETGDMNLILAASGGEALDLAASENIDVIITDIRLSETDGYEILRALKASPKTQSVPVIALSALAMREDLERGRSAGFSAYITKPMDVDNMIDTVRKCCAGKI